MKSLFDKVSAATSKTTTKMYSTSFSLGIYCLNKKLHRAIYNIYGFVRFADEIVDSFHDYDKKTLFDEFKLETAKAIERKISLNPILNSFQEVVHQYNIEQDLIDCFLKSMEMDLSQTMHNETSYNEYILGSAEVVGLMCLRVFTNGNEQHYQTLKPSAMKLGAAFQKVNFLRDLNDDYNYLGRIYFPSVDMKSLSENDKRQIELEIQQDFNDALIGIKQLPATSKYGVYVAYVYYLSLLKKIKATPTSQIMLQRIRVPNYEKISLLFSSYLKLTLNLV